MRDIVFLGSSFDDLQTFPEAVREDVVQALLAALDGLKPVSAKPLVGFKGATVLEIVESFDGNAYRAVYTVRFKHTLYVLHTFMKKSKSGIATPKRDIETIRRRLKLAEADAASREKGNERGR